jgi:hypothetical protein
MKNVLPARYPQRMKFTERSVKALRRDPDRNDYVVWNVDLPGMGVRLRDDRKTYIDQLRVNGCPAKNTIGEVAKIPWTALPRSRASILLRDSLAFIPAPRGARPRRQPPRPG